MLKVNVIDIFCINLLVPSLKIINIGEIGIQKPP